MRVLLVCSLERGGPLEQSVVLASGLVRRGLTVHVVCAANAIARRFAAIGATAESLRQRHGLDVTSAVQLWRRMRTVDVVHAQDRRSGLWTRLAPGMGAVARIYTVHGLPDAYMPAPLGPRRPSLRDRIAYQGVDAALCRRADAVIIPSRALAAVFRERLGFPGSRIRVVPNGVELPPTAGQRGDEVGTLSLLEPVKDLATFLAAAALLAPSRPELSFVVFGDGGERRALQERARELGIADRTSFPGYVDRHAALARLAVLVLPSIIESAPMAMLEAMAAGVPVVASRTGGIPEIAGADTALLVEPRNAAGFAEAIARLLDDQRLANARAEAGRERVASHYTSATSLDATLRVYEQALATRRHR